MRSVGLGFVAFGIGWLSWAPAAEACTYPPCTPVEVVLPGTVSAPHVLVRPGSSSNSLMGSPDPAPVLVTPSGDEVALERMPALWNGWTPYEPVTPVEAGEGFRVRFQEHCEDWVTALDPPVTLERTFDLSPAAAVPEEAGTATVASTMWVTRPVASPNPCDPSTGREETYVAVTLQLALDPGMEPFLPNTSWRQRTPGREWRYLQPGSVRGLDARLGFSVRCVDQFAGTVELEPLIPGASAQPKPILVDVDVACPAGEPPPPEPEPVPSQDGGCSAAGGAALAPWVLLGLGLWRSRRRVR